MDQTELETKWRTALSSILDELTDKEFRKLLVNLEKIPQGLKGGVKGGLPRGNMPSVIILHYGTEGSIALIDRQMKILPRLDAAVQQPLKEIKELKKLLKKNKGTKPATDSGAVTEKKKPAAAVTSKPAHLGAVPKKKEPAAEVSGVSGETQIMIDSTQKLTLNPQAPQKLKTRDSQDGKDLWEKSIFDLKSSGIFETEAIVGKVVKKSELLTYDTKTKKGKFFFYLGVADETASVKLMVYGEDLHRRIKEGSSYIFRELIQDGKYVKVNASSSVSETNPVNVPEEFEREAERLLYPESPLTSIKDIKSSPPQTHVSVEGTVTEIDPVKKVKVEHEEKKMKRFKMRQEAEEISVTMWGEATEQSKDLSVGDVLRLEYMKPKEYFTEVSLNSSQFTKITKVQSVGIRKVTLKIRGIKKATLKETHLEVDLDTKLHTLCVASPLLAKTLDFQLKKGFGDDLLKRIPLSVEAEIQGNRIIKMADPENI